jgi:small subunit ribosomal protein S14
MAKKSMIEREKKRLALVQKYQERRSVLKSKLQEMSTQQERVFKEQFDIAIEFQKLPRGSSKTRVHHRCFVTGRPKGYFRDFGLSRHVLREMAHQCLLPGVTKASW